MKLMYITNRVEVARIAESNGVDRIFVDLEYIGKKDRQGGMDTVQSYHTVEDIRLIRKSINKSQLLVRINPIHDASEQYISSAEEINQVVESGADIIMLPFFKTLQEVKTFLKLVDGRTKTMLLIETPEAVSIVDDILDLDGVDEVFVGLNDLSLGYRKRFMFELLADGTVEQLCTKFRLKGVPYGFGGIASIGKGMLPAERVIAEHYRLGSTCTILSRSFCNIAFKNDLDEIKELFAKGVSEIRKFEKQCDERMSWFWNNNKEMIEAVAKVTENMS